MSTQPGSAWLKPRTHTPETPEQTAAREREAVRVKSWVDYNENLINTFHQSSALIKAVEKCIATDVAGFSRDYADAAQFTCSGMWSAEVVAIAVTRWKDMLTGLHGNNCGAHLMGPSLKVRRDEALNITYNQYQANFIRSAIPAETIRFKHGGLLVKCNVHVNVKK